MAKEKQQEAPKQAEIERFAVAVSRGADGRWVFEDLRIVGNEVAQAQVLTTMDATKGVRVVAGTFLLMAEDRVQEWQKQGALK